MKKVLAALFLLLPLLTAAQTPPRLSAQVDRTRIMVGEQIVLTLTLEGSEIPDGDQLNYPQLDEYFTLVRVDGPFSEQTATFAKGGFIRSAKLTMRYFYQARKAGTVTIPAMVYNAGGQTLRTAPIQVEILAPSAPAPSDGGTGWAPPEDPFLEVKLDRSEAFVGEQVVATWNLYFQQDFSSPRMEQDPAAADFMTEDLGIAQSIDPVVREYDGEVWKQAFLKSSALYPIKAGEAVLEPMVLSLVTGRGRQRFGMFFPEPQRIASEPVSIQVKPLPEEGKPFGFMGAVGDFSLHLDRDTMELETDTPFKFVLTVRGTGYSDFISKPEIKLPPEFDLFTEKVEKSIEREAGQAFAVVRYRMIIVPHQAGEFTLGPFSLPYFDPKSENYRQAESELIRLSVKQGMNRPSAQPQDGQTVAALGQDLRYIKPDRSELPDRATLFANPVFLGGQVIPALALAAGLLLRRRRDRLSADPALARRLAAGKKSRQFLRAAVSAMRGGRGPEACDQAGRALTSFIADRFSLPEQGLTTGDAVAALRAAGVSDATVSEVEKILSECDLARFAPGALPNEIAFGMAERVEAAMKLIVREAK